MSDAVNKLNKKNQRTTQEQLHFYVGFCKRHPELQAGKNNPRAPRAMQQLWAELSTSLNAIRGPNRTPKKWKESLGHWKNQLRSRARKIKVEQQAIEGGSPTTIALRKMEDQAISTFGAAAVEGIEGPFILGYQAGNDVDSSVFQGRVGGVIDLLAEDDEVGVFGGEEMSNDTLSTAASAAADDISTKFVTPEFLYAEFNKGIDKRNQMQERTLKLQEEILKEQKERRVLEQQSLALQKQSLQQQQETSVALKQMSKAILALAQSIVKR